MKSGVTHWVSKQYSQLRDGRRKLLMVRSMSLPRFHLFSFRYRYIHAEGRMQKDEWFAGVLGQTITFQCGTEPDIQSQRSAV
jgi:hypothetical protein